MKYYRVKIHKKFDKLTNKLSSENYKKSGRLIGLDFESDNIIHFVENDGYSSDGYSSDGYLSGAYSLDGYSSDGYSSDGYASDLKSKENIIILYGKDNDDKDVSSKINVNKNGSYLFEDILFTKIDKLEGYLNIKDIYEEPCVLSVYEKNPINKKDSSEGKAPVIYGESNGSFIISSGE